MITKTTGYQSTDGVFHATIEEAQEAELICLFKDIGAIEWPIDEISRHIIERSDAIIDILTMTPKSRPKARSINGAKKTRKPKTPTVVETAAAA